MLECIDNLSFNSSINKDDEIFNLFKTKSPNINSIILSKIECHTKLFDFFNKHSNLDINAVSKSINNINNLFLNILIPNSINDNEDFEYYINVLSTIILTFHYILKIKAIIFKKVKEIQQGLIESILNSKFEEPLKDKFIEYNSLCYSALKDPFQEETTFSTFLVNKPKVMNHFNSNGQKYFNKEEPTPKFFVFDKEPKIQFNKNKKIKENNKENNYNIIKNKNEKNKKNVHRGSNKSSCSLVSMSSILVNNKNPETELQNKNINKMNIKKMKHYTTCEKKKLKSNLGNISERQTSSDKLLETEYFKSSLASKKSSKTVIVNNNGNKDLFVELLKFTNKIYKDKYINENQKKQLKQLIINYMVEKHSNKK